jgi:molecular chaperone GrpE
MKGVKDNGSRKKPIKIESEETIEEEIEPSAEESEEAQESDEDMARMQQELETARSENAAAADMMLRVAAEMDNYKKRAIKERETLTKYGSQGILQELLPILDNFQRAIESANESKDFDSFLEGVEMIFKQMGDALERKSVSVINAVGEVFDPNIHEAVVQIASEEYPENIVAEELQKGYMLHDRVIRPAMVAVSKGAGKE